MNSLTSSLVLVPGLTALLFCGVFTYLHEQSRRLYFRAWQLAWACYTLYFVLGALSTQEASSTALSFISSLFLLGMGMCLLASTRFIRDRSGLRWYDVFVGLAGIALAFWSSAGWMAVEKFHWLKWHSVHVRLETGLALLFAYCAFSFYREAHRRQFPRS